ncbi:helix-turn-helix domain-containing protein [Bradyrhizobium elkanii]|uniref:helix-turn-helix domain-containing protein n=1 Tax=Bradyrhizobium elkanii TaxID=29448 RepID=UPI001FEE90DB|nr:helix-turn-helix domain-containing protein [Bradyrhizobium elkanii]
MIESVGSSFLEFVLGQRLARAHHLLTDPRNSGSTIGTIAFEVGFGHLSYFNRTFRRQYRVTPSDIRAVPRRSWPNIAISLAGRQVVACGLPQPGTRRSPAGDASQTALSASLCAVAHTRSSPITSAAGDFGRQCTTTCFTLLPDVAYVQSPVAPVRACQSSRV